MRTSARKWTVRSIVVLAVGGIILCWTPMGKGVIARMKFRNLILNQREEIEADMRAVYEKNVANMSVWNDNKNSDDEDALRLAIDAWHELRSDPGRYYDAMCRWLEYGDLPEPYSFVGMNNSGTAFYEHNTIIWEGKTNVLIGDILWGGRLAPDDLPEELVAPSKTDFPKYFGGPMYIEDKARELYETFERSAWGTIVRNAKVYDVYAEENREVLEGRGFFVKFPHKIELPEDVANGTVAIVANAKDLYGCYSSLLGEEIKARYKSRYNKFVDEHEEVLEEQGFFDGYPRRLGGIDGDVAVEKEAKSIYEMYALVLNDKTTNPYAATLIAQHYNNYVEDYEKELEKRGFFKSYPRVILAE